MVHIPHAVKVAVGVSGAVVVDNDIDTLHIDATTKYVGGHQDTLLERLEGGVASNTVQCMSQVTHNERSESYTAHPAADQNG